MKCVKSQLVYSVSESLANITGTLATGSYNALWAHVNPDGTSQTTITVGALTYHRPQNSIYPIQSSTSNIRMTWGTMAFNAADSNSIYKNNATVTPLSRQTTFLIRY